MKTKFTFTFLKKMMLLLGLVYLTACQKEISQISPENKVNAEAIAKINSWLDAKKPGRNAVVSAVQNNLSFPDMKFEKLNEKENLIIVPIKDGFKSAVNKDKNPANYLLLIVNEAGKIRKGNIVQFTGLKGIAAKKLPDNTFHNFYNADYLVCDGRFTFVNMSDKTLYAMEYTGGKLSAYSQKQTTPDTGSGNPKVTNTASLCTDWYWVTTYYNADGTSSTEAQFLYTTCNNSDEYLEPEGEGGPGNGWNEEEVETIMLPVQIDWYVCDLDDYSLPSTSDWWQLFSTERFFGTKKASIPGGGFFTKIEHLGETITGQSAFTWHKTGVTVAYEKLVARSIISGTVKKNGTVRANVQSRYRDFPFSYVFP